MLPIEITYHLNHWESKTFSSYLDSKTGSILSIPNSIYTQLNPECKFITLQTDSFGLRNNEEFNHQKIIVIGDSFVYADGVNHEDRFTEQVGRTLRQDVYTIAAGHSAAPQQLVLLNRVLKNIENYSGLIIWCIYSGNDIGDSFRNAKNDIGNSNNVQRKISGSRYIMKHLLSARIFFVMARLLNKEISYHLYTGKKLRLNDKEFHIFLSNKQGQDYDKKGLVTIFSTLDTLHKRVQNLPIQLLFVYIPSKEESFAEELEISYSINEKQIHTFNADFLEQCKKSDWNCLSLLNAFKERTVRGHNLYFQYDAHWNPAGHRYAAELITQHLETS
jgi:lysophospholipase L1-like esterase